MKISPFLDWTGVPLVSLIDDSTGLPTVVENDVRALTAAEHWFGAAAGHRDFVLITIGAGVACGIVVDDRLVDGAAGGSGQIGHLPITEWGPLCERGHRGCVRSYLSSPSIVGQVSAALGRDVDYHEVLTLAAGGNPVARRVVDEAGRALGTLIGTIAAITAPDKILISGEGVDLAPLAMTPSANTPVPCSTGHCLKCLSKSRRSPSPNGPKVPRSSPSDHNWMPRYAWRTEDADPPYRLHDSVVRCRSTRPNGRGYPHLAAPGDQQDPPFSRSPTIDAAISGGPR